MEVIVTGISKQFSRGLAFWEVKGLQYLIERFSATAPIAREKAAPQYRQKTSLSTDASLQEIRVVIAEPWFDAKPDMAYACADLANTGVVDGNRGE